MNAFLVSNNKNETDQNKESNVRIWALAVKLCSLKKNDLSIMDLLDRSVARVIIDAENYRLDDWLIEQIALHNLSKVQLDRIFITVQARRSDAESQLNSLDKLGVRVVLVAGHQSYSQNTQVHVTTKMISLVTKYSNIQIIGVNGHRMEIMKDTLGIRSDNFEWLELYGIHSKQKRHEKHLLWTYLALDSQFMGLSHEGNSYLKRRMHGDHNRQNYIVSTFQQLQSLSNDFGIVVYFDILSKNHFYTQLSLIR